MELGRSIVYTLFYFTVNVLYLILNPYLKDCIVNFYCCIMHC